MFATLLKLSPIFIFALPGVIAAALYPGRDPKTTFITLLNDLLPNGVRGLVLAALISALIGSSLSVMNSISTLVVKDFLLHFSTNASKEPRSSWGAWPLCYHAIGNRRSLSHLYHCRMACTAIFRPYPSI